MSLSIRAQLPGALLAAPVLALAACKGSPDLPESGGSYTERGADSVVTHRNGPGVRLVKTGPARFVRPLYDGFDVPRAMNLVGFMDQRVRTPGSPGFDEVLDSIERSLRAAGYGLQQGLELEVLVTETEDPAWWPVSARVSIASASGERVLHSFDDPADVDRCMLPRHAPSASVSGQVAFGLETLSEGEILVTKTRVRPDLVNRASSRGAIAIVSASLGSYNVDPTGRGRHVDAVQYREMPSGLELPVAQISERSYALIEEEMLRSGEVRLSLEARVETGDRRVRALVATIPGTGLAEEAVVVASHVQEPGACDNASGAAGLLECALGVAHLIQAEELERPKRSLVMIWGMEFGGSEAWLEATELEPVAMVNPVMVGESRRETGAIPLLERYPDPGAVEALPPDQHSLWGARDVEPEWLERSNGLALIGRCALADVSLASGGWETSENPYEGGTDHERFIQHGVPAVLFWHFTDFAFNTSLDRIDMVDGEELRRMSVAAMATAMAVAAPRAEDLDRYLESNLDEYGLRAEAAEAADRPELAEDWERWCTGVRHWFRWLCLGAERPEPGVEPAEVSEGDLADEPE